MHPPLAIEGGIEIYTLKSQIPVLVGDGPGGPVGAVQQTVTISVQYNKL